MSNTTAVNYRNEMIQAGCKTVGTWSIGDDAIIIYELTEANRGTATKSPVTHFVYAPEGIGSGWEFVSGLNDAYDSAADFADQLGESDIADTIRTNIAS